MTAKELRVWWNRDIDLKRQREMLAAVGSKESPGTTWYSLAAVTRVKLELEFGND